MSVEIQDSDFEVLNWGTRGGVTEDDIAYSVNAYREEGRSDEEIQQIFNQHIGRLRPQYDRVMAEVRKPNPELEQMKAKQQWMDKYVDPVMEAVGMVGHTAGRVGNTMTFGLFDVGAGLVDKSAEAIGIQTGLVDYISEANKKWPLLSTAASLGGLFYGGPKAVMELTTKGVSKALGTGTTWLGGAARGAASGVAGNLVVQAGMEIQRTAEKIANTRVAETEKEFYDRVTTETAWSVGLGAATGAIMGGPIGGFIRKQIDAQMKAVDLAGGAEVVRGAQNEFARTLINGGTTEQAEANFWKTVMSKADPRKQEHIKHLIKTDPQFGQYMRQQMASAGEVVTDTMNKLTKKQLGEYAHQIRKSLYGEGYLNRAGSTDFDNTKEGMAQILGTDDGGAMFKAREEALGRAREAVAANPQYKNLITDEFAELSAYLQNKGEGVYQTMLNKVEAGTLKSFQDSKESTEVIEDLIKWKQAREANGLRVSPTQIEDKKAELTKAAAQRYFNRKMRMGVDDIDDLNDIKSFFAESAPGDVSAGQKTVLGKFDEGINAKIYDKIDRGLYESNQAYRYTQRMQEMHEFGRTFDPEKDIVALSRNLANTTDAEFAAAKLAAVKMGWTERLIDTAVDGGTTAFEELASKMTSGPLSEYFSKSEVEQIVNQVRPHIQTKFLIDQNLKAAKGVAELDKTDAQILRTITSAGVGARGAFIGNLTTTFQNYKYGPKTAKALMELTQNPTLENLNKMIRGTTDATEKRALMKSIYEAFNNVKRTLQGTVQLAEEAAVSRLTDRGGR